MKSTGTDRSICEKSRLQIIVICSMGLCFSQVQGNTEKTKVQIIRQQLASGTRKRKVQITEIVEKWGYRSSGQS